MAKKNRVRTPTRLQMEAAECGAACLAIILEYYGSYVPLEALREACGVSRDGSKASNVLKAARTYALNAKGFRKEPDQLVELKLPAVLHWNFNHFVVLEGITPDRVYLNDPASGPRVVSREELGRAFTGVVLTFEPAPEYKPSGHKPSVLSSLAQKLRHSWAAIWYVVLVGLALVIPGLATPIFSRVFVDEILVGGNEEWLRPLLFGMAGTAALYSALTWLQREYLLRLSLKLSITMSATFLWHVLRLPVTFFNARFPGEIASRVHYNDRVAQVLSSDLTAHLLNVFRIVFFAALMLYYDVVLTLLAFGACVLNAVVLRASGREQTDLAQEALQERGKMVGAAMGGLQMIETLKAGGTEGDFFTKWAGHFAKVTNLEQRVGVRTHVFMAIPPLLSAISSVAVLGVGALRVIDGHISMGMLVAFQSLMASLMGPIEGMMNGAQQWIRLKADLSRVDDVMKHPRAPGYESDAREESVPDRLVGAIELRNLTYGYSKLANPTVQNVSLSLVPGGRTALVGGSGSGKSTLGKLVCGLYEPWSGEILFDGKDRSQHAPASLTSSIAWVDQEVFLFEGTVRENLSMWNPLVAEADLVQAAKDACIHDDIVRLRGGYNARVDEAGRNFSGGQRQRLEIARALVGKPSIIVLDEATSALDPETEKKVDDHLRRRGCSLLIIAHRLSTIRDSDEIIVLERGTVVERGTNEVLLSKQGAYARLIASM